MSHATDLTILALYTLAVVALGSSFFRKSRTPRGFMVAGWTVPAWALGFGTYLSSNTFLGYPGRAFALVHNSDRGR